MNIYTKVVVISVSALLSACATEKVGNHSYYKGTCTDCFNNPISGEPINYQKGEEKLASKNDSSSAAADEPAKLPKGKPECLEPVKFDLTTQIDVDTTYARIKREFGYRTLDEMTRAWGMNPAYSQSRNRLWLDEGYRHDTEPGVRYALNEAVTPNFPGNQERNWISVDIDKDGTGSRVYVGYCNGGTAGFTGGASFHEQLQREISSLLSR